MSFLWFPRVIARVASPWHPAKSQIKTRLLTKSPTKSPTSSRCSIVLDLGLSHHPNLPKEVRNSYTTSCASDGRLRPTSVEVCLHRGENDLRAVASLVVHGVVHPEYLPVAIDQKRGRHG